jgi:hypothetical protein
MKPGFIVNIGYVCTTYLIMAGRLKAVQQKGYTYSELQFIDKLFHESPFTFIKRLIQ